MACEIVDDEPADRVCFAKDPADRVGLVPRKHLFSEGDSVGDFLFDPICVEVFLRVKRIDANADAACGVIESAPDPLTVVADYIDGFPQARWADRLDG